MIKIYEDFQGVADQLMRLLALHVHDKAQAAGVVFELWIVKALLRRRGNLWLRVPFISRF
jgi:hypothetical protein